MSAVKGDKARANRLRRKRIRNRQRSREVRKLLEAGRQTTSAETRSTPSQQSELGKGE